MSICPSHSSMLGQLLRQHKNSLSPTPSHHSQPPLSKAPASAYTRRLMEVQQHPDHLPIPDFVKPDKPLPQPGVTLLRRLPETFSGNVRYRRRRKLWREWTSAVAHLKGASLLITNASGTPLTALEVNQVSHRTYPNYILFNIRSSIGTDTIIRVYDNPQQWLEALLAVTGSRKSRLSDFEVVAPVGKGGGGAVYFVKEKGGDGTPLAMKVVQKHDAFFSDGSLRHALDERLVLELVRGFPFVVRLTHAFQTEKALYMVSDFYSGGDLKTLLRRQKGSRLPEEEARTIMAQVILAIEHIHSLNCIYRDLKPENILLTPDGDVRLCDFGLSKVLSTGRFGRTKSFCGSTSYMSPQVVTGKPYGIAADMFSMGSLFFRMLVGRTPFEQTALLGARNDSHEVQKRIQLDDPKFPSFLSPAAREMLEALLRKSETERMNLQDLKESMFFRGVDWNAVLEEGYERAARPTNVLAGKETENFDSQRLISQGVALDDKELRRKRTPLVKDAEKQTTKGFAKRHTSVLQSISLRDLKFKKRQQSELSIIGFGYNYASDASQIPSSDTETSSSGRDATSHNF